MSGKRAMRATKRAGGLAALVFLALSAAAAQESMPTNPPTPAEESVPVNPPTGDEEVAPGPPPVSLETTANPPPTAETPDSTVYEMDPIVVTATRTPQKVSDIAANITVLDSNDLKLSAPSRLDDVLRQVPGFSLLRQSSSVVSSISLQGVSMRGIGPTNTGRTLVLMDGVPLNDPFSGHVTWSRIPLGSIERIEVVRGGGSPIWGSLALGGVIHILTHKPQERSLHFRGQGGELGTENFELFASEDAGPVTFSAGGSYFDTNGYVIWRDDQVGPIDEPAKLTSGTFLGRVDYRPSNSTRVYFDGSYADEDRKKGTPLGESGFITRSYGAGTEIATEDLGQWNVNLFHMSRDSHNFSTTVSTDRTSERPSGNEYKAPCMSIGANLMWSKQLVEAHRLSVGLDQTWLEGESFAYGGYSTTTGDFTTDKHVQGKEHLIGAYLQDIWRISPQWQVVGSARFDVLRNFDASDVIVERSTGAVLRESIYPDAEKSTLNPSLGVVYHANEDVSIRSSVYRAFRAPTISELYEGFIGRDGTVTVGNAELEPEILLGAEAGVDFHPRPTWSAKATGFWNEVENSIAQHTIGFADPDEATVIPPCDLIPAGGVCRQTDNVGKLRSAGLELEASYRPWESWLFTASYTYDDATVIESDDPALVGKRVRQVPEHQYVLRGSFDRPSLLSSSLQGRFIGDRFEDDLNTLPIEDFFVVDFLVNRRVNSWSEVFLTVENVFDTEYEVRASANGMIEIGAPRIIQAGVRLDL